MFGYSIPHARPRRRSTLAAQCIVLLLAGCGVPRNGVSPTNPASPEEALRLRAEQRFDALVKQDWPRVYETQDPAYKASMTREAYLKERKEMGVMFRFLHVDLGRVEVQGDMGWVETDQKKKLTPFPDNPPVSAHVWEKWKRVDGQWYPCSSDESKALPVQPSLRDLAEEPALGARVEAYCRTRLTQDLTKLAEYINPPDRDKLVGPDAGGGRDEPFKIVGYKIRWVEVLPEQGRARIAYETHTTDPNQSKLPTSWVQVTERWLKIDGQWYRDLQ